MAHPRSPALKALLGRARALAGDMVAAPPVAAAGRSVGTFELLEEIGRGSFGCVYRARDTELERTVAIKVLHAGSLPGPVEVERFLREARSAAQLKHPGIVLLYGASMSHSTVAVRRRGEEGRGGAGIDDGVRRTGKKVTLATDTARSCSTFPG